MLRSKMGVTLHHLRRSPPAEFLLQDSVNQVGQEFTRRSLNVQPTLTVRPGFPLRVIAKRDLVLPPYQPLFFEKTMR